MENLDQIVADLNTLNDQSRFAEALAEVDSLLNQEQNESSLYVIKGNALYGLGRFEEALTAYAQAIEIDTFDVQARCNYGSTLYVLGRYVDALNACDAAILTDDQFAPSYINVAHCLAALHHEDEAVYALQQAFMLEPNDAVLGRTVADMAADLDNYEVARDTYFAVAALPNAASDTDEAIFRFFVNAKQKGTDRVTLMKDIDLWRQKFGRNPNVLRLSGELLKG